MKEPAIYRTPVEIWREIILEATYWDPVPTDASPDLEKLLLFSRGCFNYHSYLQSVSFRGTLRLVSRTWNEVIKEMAHELVIMGASEQYWPSSEPIYHATCIEYTPDSQYCTCQRRPKRRAASRHKPFGLRLPPGYPSEQVNTNVNWEVSGTIQARIILVEESDSSFHKLCERAPNLRVLSLGNQSEMRDILSWLGDRGHQHLTHLRVTEILPGEWEGIVGQLSLPNLKHLELQFLPESETPHEVIKPTSIWEFPQLDILQVTGITTKAIKDGLIETALKSRQTLTVVVLAFNWEEDGVEDAWVGDHVFWDSFQRLSLFGISLEWFVDAEGEAPGPTPASLGDRNLTVFILEFFADHDWTAAGLTHCAKNIIQWSESFGGRVQRVMMEYSWSDVAAVAKSQGREGFEMCRVFFGEIRAGEVPFCDKNGIYLTDKEAEPFLKGLEKNRFPAGYVARQLE